ncbi:phage tail protein [Tardiphaga sp. 538_B7_N1_4]|uniref:phage tail protein n=1 Tax=Tardiphaga sp. 538_B7_N1_4 TaxID=3240778 RepID=UPI003F246D17
MTTGLFMWSQTASANATADSSVNYAEGQAPSSLNDSARAAMASVAKWRDDISGAIVTAGTSTAYTVTSYSGFDTLAHMNGMMIAFTPHATNTGTVTLNVDGLGAKPLRGFPGVELPSGSLILGTPYVALYNNSDAAFYIHGGAANAYAIPLAGGMDYWASTAPNSAFAFPVGQAISRTTYATLFSLIGTNYGVGDGSTTFNLPNKAGRVSAMKEASASLLTSTYFGGNSTALGAVGGLESHTLTTPQTPSHRHDAFISDPGHVHPKQGAANGLNVPGNASFGSQTAGNTQIASIDYGSATTGIIVYDGGVIINATGLAGGGGAHANVQPTIVCNYIMRVI